MLRAAALLLALAFVSLAGCASPPKAESNTPAPPPAPIAPVTTLTKSSFGWMAGVGIPTTGLDAQYMASNGASIPVPENATRLVVYTNWTCATPNCVLHVSLFDSKNPATPGFPPMPAKPVQAGQGAAAVKLEVLHPKAGDWLVAVHSDGPVAQVQGSFVFQLTAPPVSADS
jgi:hypothetical protein